MREITGSKEILLVCVYDYFLRLKIIVNDKQAIANRSPATARITYIAVRATETVTTSLIGTPSLGTPSAE